MTFTIIKKTCTQEAELMHLAASLARVLPTGTIVYLRGPLGAGKTTFVRGFLMAHDYHGKVKSPTFSILEQYAFANAVINHFDLYRLVDEEELEQIGIRDYFQPNAICLIEWPERAATTLPPPDIQCEIDFAPEGRAVTLAACNERVNEILRKLTY